MKAKKIEIIKKAKDLVLEAKNKNVIKSHNTAFKEFPVEEEIHKGKMEDYK